MGADLVKTADEPVPAYSLGGALYLSPTGWVMLAVPATLVRGVFAAMTEPGVELPPPGPDGRLNAHISVFSPEDVALIGGADKITERGKQFTYTLGRLVSVDPDGWPGISRAWMIRIHSVELQRLRRAYGLSSLPADGKRDFHITVGVRRRGVLGRNDVAKGGTTSHPETGPA
jgi:hypothetical protein